MSSDDLYKAFSVMMEHYSSSFENAAKNPHQILQFCKNNNYEQFKYGDIKRLFAVWQKSKEKNETLDCDQNIQSDEGNQSDGYQENKEIDNLSEERWDSLWKEYENSYKYQPKKAKHLWNFVRDEKLLNVKYCYARKAFERISQSMDENIETNEGQLQPTTNQKKNEIKIKINLNLKITSEISSERLKEIYDTFKNLYITFQKTQKNHPKNATILFRFINNETDYKVCYRDINKIFHIAMKENWFKTKDSKEILQENNNEQNNSDEMSDDIFDEMLINYQKMYNNPPNNAVQIMNFAKDEMKQIYKYKVVRVAFYRWIRRKSTPK